MHAFARDPLGQCRHRRVGALVAIEKLPQARELRVAEPGADPTGIMQCPAAIVVAEQQRAEPLPPAGRVGEPDDHELLAIGTFHLEPAVAASGPIGLVAAFRNDPFEREPAGLAEKRRAAAGLVVAVAQHAGRTWRNDPGQRRLAVFERGSGEVPAVAVEQVEGIIEQRLGPPRRDLVLQAGKARRTVGPEIHNLAVDRRRFDRQRRQPLGQRRKFSGPVEAAAGRQPRRAAGDPGQQAIAVIFDFVEPLRPVGRVLRQFRQLHRQLFRQRSLARAGNCHGADCGSARRIGIGIAPFAARLPDAIAVGGDLRDGAAGFDAERALVEDRAAASGQRCVVAFLDQEPVVAALFSGPAAHPHQRPAPVQLLAVEPEFERAVLIGAGRVGVERRPIAAIPQHDRAAAILSLRDDPLEPAIIERVVFDMDRQAPLARIEARPFGHRPAFQHPVELQAEIVMQPARRVLLHDKGERPRFGAAPDGARRLRGLAEIALSLVLGQRHDHSAAGGSIAETSPGRPRSERVR